MSTVPIDKPFQVAGCTVDPQLLRIDLGDHQIGVEPKILAVLLSLARSPGEVVTRRELLDTVWDGGFVTDDVLTRAVAELRRIFDDNPRDPRVIETIRRRGYRLLAAVEPVGARPPRQRRRRPVGSWLAAGVVLGAAGALVLGALGRGADNAPAATAPTATTPTATAPTGTAPTATAPTATALQSSPSYRIVPLTAEPGQERDPAVSPDGQRVAFAARGADGSFDLFIATRDGGGRRAVTKGADHDRYPTWSPDGIRLAFARLGGSTSETCERRVIDTVSGLERRIADCDPGLPQRMAWSPDGKHLAVVAPTPDGTWGIRFVDLATAAETQVTRPKPPARGDADPVFSPDGRFLAFGRSSGAISGDLYAVRLADLVERRLTFDRRDIVGHTFDADGRQVVFASDRGGVYGLWQVPIAGGEPSRLTASGNKIKHPSHAYRAPVLAWEDWRFEISIMARPLGGEGATTRAVVVSTQWDFGPAVSPDGERLAFVSSRTGTHQLWMLDLADVGDVGDRGDRKGHGDPTPTQLTRASLQVTSPPVWSPDGGRLAFTALRDGQHDAWVLEIGPWTPRRLETGASYVRSPAWSRDGRWLYYTASPDGGPSALYRVPTDAAGSQAERLLDDVLAAHEAVAGGLLFVRQTRDGLWRVDAGAFDAPPSLVTAELRRRSHASWTLVSRAEPVDEVVWLDTRGDVSWIRSVRPGAAPKHVARLASLARDGIAIAPEGRTLYYATVRRAESDILLGENVGLRTSLR